MASPFTVVFFFVVASAAASSLAFSLVDHTHRNGSKDRNGQVSARSIVLTAPNGTEAREVQERSVKCASHNRGSFLLIIRLTAPNLRVFFAFLERVRVRERESDAVSVRERARER